MQVSSAILASVFGVWDVTELAEDIIIDYIFNYTDEYNAATEKEKLSIGTEFCDQLLGNMETVDDKLEALDFRVGIFKNTKTLVDALRGYSIDVKTFVIKYNEILKDVMVYDESAGTIVVNSYQMSHEVARGVIVTNSPITMDAMSAFAAGLNIANGVIDLADTMNTAAAVRANQRLFDKNTQLLLRIRDHGNRKYICEAAANVANYMGKGYGNALYSIVKECGMDVAQMSRNLLETFLSMNPYLAALKFVKDIMGNALGINETLIDEYEMLTYDCMSECAAALVRAKVIPEGEHYYCYDMNVQRYMTNLAQLRILGEKKYIEYYTNGIGGWFVNQNRIINDVNARIARVKNNCMNVDVVLDSSIK